MTPPFLLFGQALKQEIEPIIRMPANLYTLRYYYWKRSKYETHILEATPACLAGWICVGKF